jgi:hypothetical protein
MFPITEGSITRLVFLSLLACILGLSSLTTAARLSTEQKKTGAPSDSVTGEGDDKNAPPYHEYKGVRIGMTADEARKKLGDPSDKGDKQDFYAFSDGNEMAQIFYDAEKKVFALSVIYMSSARGAPTAKSVLGVDLEPKPDGSIHRKIDYPKAGFWVAYSRSQGDAPMVTVTMQKKQ